MADDTAAAEQPAEDRTIYRPELQRMLGRSSETMRKWLKAGKLPEPDIALTPKTMGWRLSTLRKHGINLA